MFTFLIKTHVHPLLRVVVYCTYPQCVLFEDQLVRLVILLQQHKLQFVVLFMDACWGRSWLTAADSSLHRRALFVCESSPVVCWQRVHTLTQKQSLCRRIQHSVSVVFFLYIYIYIYVVAHHFISSPAATSSLSIAASYIKSRLDH